MSAAIAPCACSACRWRSLRAPLILIALGVLLLLHMLRPPEWSVPVLVGAFLIFLGVLAIVENVLPLAATPAPPAHRSSPWAGPVLLVAIGALIVATHALSGFNGAAWIARYWPVLFIVWGCGRLLEYYLAPGRRRAGLSAGEVVLLVVLVLAGAAFSSAYRYREATWWPYVGWHFEDWNPMFQTYTFSSTAQAALAPASRVEVHAWRGSVRLVAAPGSSTALASVNDRIHAADQDDARRIFAQVQPDVNGRDGVVVVAPAGGWPNGQVETDLQLTLPPATPVTVALTNGSFEADGWQANLQCAAGHGRVTVHRLTGNLELDANHDDVDIGQVDGEVTVRGTGGDVTLADIGGRASLQGEYSGRLAFRHLVHGLALGSMRTQLALGALAGTLDSSLSRMDFEGPADAIQLQTRNKEVTIAAFTGPLDVTDTNSSLRVTAAAPPRDTVSLATSNGDIELTLPANSNFHLDASARNGDIESDFGVPVTRYGASAGTHADVGSGGPEIRLTTRNANIILRRVMP